MTAYFVAITIILASLSNFLLLTKRNDAFSANAHRSVVFELFAPHQQQKEVNKGTKGNGEGEAKEGKSGRERMARQQQQRKLGECERLNEVQKYAKLESIGGRNQIFLAASPREAGRNFPALMPKRHNSWKNVGEEEPSAMFFMDFAMMDNAVTSSVDVPSSSHNVEACDEQCREIERKLNNVVEMKWPNGDTEMDDRGTSGIFRMDDDAEEEAALEEDEPNGDAMGTRWGTGATGGLRIRTRNGCYLERFVPIGNCTKHGFEESAGDEKLCTACQGIFVLNRECFPMFVNAVVCDRREFECIYDRISGDAQGKCRPKVLGFKVMRNRATTTKCEHWIFESIEVPVACECYLSKRSVWLEAVPPSMEDEHLR